MRKRRVRYRRPPRDALGRDQLRLWPRGMDEGWVVDLFAGGGGASTGLEAALGRPVDVAVNHNETAIAVHEANHPNTIHHHESVWNLHPLEVTKGRPVSVLWASPDCTHFSRAKGSSPGKKKRSKRIRALANVVVRWATHARPAVIFVENVAEFLGWGPLDKRTKEPIKARAGESFRRWKRGLERLGYVVEHRVLDASRYGAPTKRKRLFIVARCDGEPIVWPEPTHGPGLLPFHTAAECIDWTNLGLSIFEREAYGLKPLAEKTLWRIAMGIRRFVLENPHPFIIRYNGSTSGWRGQGPDEPLTTIDTSNRFGVVTPNLIKVNHGKREARGEGIDEPMSTVTAERRGHGLVAAVLQQSGYGERKGQKARALNIEEPIGTLVDGQKHALVTAFLAKAYGDPKRKKGGGRVIGKPVTEPLDTVTGRDHHQLAALALAKFRGTSASHPGCASVDAPMPTISAGGGKGGGHVGQVAAFLTAYYGSDGTGGQRVDDPARTVTSRDRLGLVSIGGVEHQVTDIYFRMVEDQELLRAQFGRFAKGYDLSAAKTKAKRVKLIGNSVPPEMVEALVRVNKPRGMAPQESRAA